MAAAGTSRSKRRADTRVTRRRRAPLPAGTITHRPGRMRGAKVAHSKRMADRMPMLRELRVLILLLEAHR